jgi:PAS domain-containing protein
MVNSILKSMDSELCSTDRGRKWLANAMLLISLPILGLSAYAAHKAGQERDVADQALGAMRVLNEENKSPIIALDSDGRILTWTKNAQDIFGYTADEALGKTPQFLMPKSLRERHMEAYQEAMLLPIDTAKTLRIHCYGLNKANKRVEIFITARTLPHEKLGRVSVAIIDRTRDVVEIDATDPNNIKKIATK